MKNFLVTATCILLLNIVTAQTKLGVRGGWNYSTAKIFENNIKQQTQYISGYSAGIFFKAPFEDVLHFSPSINFSHRGYAYMPSSGGIIKTQNKVNYIDIIPALSLDFATGSQSAFIVGVSPVLSIAITGKEKNTHADNSVTTTDMIFDFNNYSRVDLGLTGSLGYKFGDKIILEGAYFYGLGNVENNEGHSRNIQNRSISVTLGYYLK